MVTNLTLLQFNALTYDYIPHMKLELAEMIIYLYIVEKGTVVTKAYVTSDPEGRKQNMIISSESEEFVDDLVERSVKAYEIYREINPDAGYITKMTKELESDELTMQEQAKREKGGQKKDG